VFMDFSSDPVWQIKVCVDSNGVLTGIRFKSVSQETLTAGQWCGSESQIAFGDIDNVFTNMETYRKSQADGLGPLWGAKFTYTGPAW
jgi:hypothetical protein